jgi:nitroreductase
MRFLSLAMKRRSVRNFRIKNVTEDNLYYMIDAARWAPSASNLQPWRFVIVREAENKKKVARACYEQDWLERAPVLIVVCSLTSVIEEQFPKHGKLFAKQSVSAAIQNMLLAAEERRLSTCWAGISSANKIIKALRIADGVEVHAVIGVGYSITKETPPPRIHVADLLSFEQWDSAKVDYVKGVYGLDSKPLLDKKAVTNLKDKANNFKAKFSRKKK